MEIGAEGVKAATTIAKAIPYIAFAVMVIEVGMKIVLNQKAMKEKQIEMYDKISEINEDNINNLWQAMNDFTLYKGDEAHRIASVMKITNALDESRNSLRKLSKEANNGKPINDHLVYAMKTALDVYSFSYLLNIMYSNVDDSTNLIENARKSISEQTLVYNDILDRCHNQYVESQRKHSKLLDNTQYDNTNKSKEYVAKRVAINVLTGGLAELGSLGSKKIGQKVEKNDKEILKRLEECKKMENPYAQCIENAGELLFLEKPVLRDDKYLYYQVG